MGNFKRRIGIKMFMYWIIRAILFWIIKSRYGIKLFKSNFLIFIETQLLIFYI
jgi:hypothetical protein